MGEPRLLREIAENYCRTEIVPRLVRRLVKKRGEKGLVVIVQSQRYLLKTDWRRPTSMVAGSGPRRRGVPVDVSRHEGRR